MLGNAVGTVNLTPYFIKAGDAAHEGRNHMTGYNNAAYPSLLCADTMLAQVEAIGRDLCSLATHKYDLSVQLSNATKCIKCAKANLQMFIDEKIAAIQHGESEDAANPPCAQVSSANDTIKLCETAEVSLTQAATALAEAVAAQAVADLGLPVGTLEIRRTSPTVPSSPTKDFFGEAFVEVEKSKTIQGPTSFISGSQTILALAAAGCNLAHAFQTQMSPFIRLTPFNENANKVINNAGNMENRFRAIEAKVKELSNAAPNHHDHRSLSVGMKNEMAKQLNKIRTADVVAVNEAKSCGRSQVVTGDERISRSQVQGLDNLDANLGQVETIAQALERVAEEMVKVPQPVA